jgi:5'-nucleotidase
VTASTEKILLCTNDDGIHSPGLSLLRDSVTALGNIWIVAPDREQSASSHALTLHRPLRLTKVNEHEYAVDGTPTDCVFLAIKEVLESEPNLVLSGVNHGPNMGEDVLYSGTVAAAMEAAVLGIPGAAISFVGHNVEMMRTYKPLLTALLSLFLESEKGSHNRFLNINLPNRPLGEIAGVQATTLGSRVYHDSLTRSVDPRNREYLWIGGGRSAWEGREDSDFRAVQAGYVSVTPMHFDLTDYEGVHKLSRDLTALHKDRNFGHFKTDF